MNEQQFKALIEQASQLHKRMGEDLAGLGGVHRCKVCGHQTEPLTAEQISSYLKSGWPRHCGQGMRWITQRELDQEIKQ